jgi:asparagine synthase (glutamine-hydrolysing)
VPLGVWFKGGLTDLFADVLHSTRTEQRGYFEPSFIRRLVREHQAGDRDHTLRLWQLLVFELWHRQYLDQSGVGSPNAHLHLTPFTLSR